MSSKLEEQVQWLVDRMAISDLLYSFASALDSRDYRAYTENYADGGYIELPDPLKPGESFVLRKERMLEQIPKSIGRYSATQHLSANHQITIEGGIARSRSYLQAVHVTGAPSDHWTAGGWYDCEYVRSSDGWKFTRVKLTPVWLEGAPAAIRPET